MKKIILLVLVLLLSGCTSDIENSGDMPQEEMIAEEEMAEKPQTTPEPEPFTAAEDIADENFSDIDNSPSGWGFKKEKGKEPEIYASTKELFRKYDTYYIDENREKVLYLTFDEGYENGYTGKILDVLKEQEVPAAFFVTGPYIENETELIERMIAEGHIVGNHTVNHPNLPKLGSAEKMAEELIALNEKFLTKYGIPMKYMRPPEGEYSERLLAVADALGYKTILWSFAYKDWDPSAQKGAEYAFSSVTPYLHNGAILLLHAVSRDNAQALSDIISYAKDEGYVFKSLDDLTAAE